MSENPFNFAGKVALVTGGGRGIGRATALLFARYGAKVVIGDIDPAGVATVDMIKQERGDALFVQTDVRDASDVKNLVAAAVKTYGGLHCAFNNAGVLPTGGLLADVEEAAFDQVVAVDLKGAFLSMKYEIEYMLGAGGGAIVNNASILESLRTRASAHTWRRSMASLDYRKPLRLNTQVREFGSMRSLRDWWKRR